jgi:nucleoid DNA-binding protein
MTLNKKKMVRKIGQRTRLKNREVQQVVETLIDVWTEALIVGEKIEIENFLVMEVIDVDRGENSGRLGTGRTAPRYIRRLVVRLSKAIRSKIQ